MAGSLSRLAEPTITCYDLKTGFKAFMMHLSLSELILLLMSGSVEKTARTYRTLFSEFYILAP